MGEDRHFRFGRQIDSERFKPAGNCVCDPFYDALVYIVFAVFHM